MSLFSCPDETLHFPNDMTIELSYKNTTNYSKCRCYDSKIMAQGYVWHQIVVQHNGKARGMEGSRDILDSIFDVLEGEEFFPIAYRRGQREDRFLVRQCQAALDKLFAQNLLIQLSNAAFVQVKVQLNVGDYKFGQLSPTAKIAQALNQLYDCMERVNGEDGILNVSNFANNKAFYDIVINLGNRGVLERICDTIYRNDEKFRTVNGIILSNNNITSVAPLTIFAGIDFAILDLRDNQLRSAKSLCRDLKEIKADELYLAGNPITKSTSYPECLKPLLKNFKLIDGIAAENLSKDYTPMDTEVDVEGDGYRIDWSNKADIKNFQKSDDWHAVMIPDIEQEFSKAEIFDYFFITVAPTLSDVYPCYYKFAMGEHQFLLRQCFDQLQHLVDNCNLEIKIPRLDTTVNDEDGDINVLRTVQIEKTLVYYLRMNISPFKRGQVEPMECIEKALARRFSAMDRLLNLDDFQKTEGLENIIFNLSSPKILGRLLMQASRKYLSSCIELRLAHNKILTVNIPKVLSLMTSLKAIDLANNWIHDLSDIKELHTLGLRSLRLDGNPLCAQYGFAGEYIKAVRRIFPDLNKLDNIELSPKGNLSTQKNFLCDVKGYDFVEQFVKLYFETFESQDRINLRDLYHKKAIFSLTCSYVPATTNAQNYRRIAKYNKYARNIFQITDFKRAITSLLMGPEEIMHVQMSLPNVVHDTLSFTTDTTIFNENTVVLTVSGLFNDLAPTIADTDILMAFSRTFVLMPMQRNLGPLKCAVFYQIVNEQCNIFNPTVTQMKNAFKYYKNEDANNSAALTLADKEALLVMLQEVSQVKAIWCTRLLEDSKWNFPKALELLIQLCQKKEIPETAFI